MELDSYSRFDKLYKKLLSIGFDEQVAAYISNLEKEGMITDDEWDTKALEALKSLPSNAAISLLENLKSSNYRNAINKSAYLFSAIKAQRQRLSGERTNTPTLSTNGNMRTRSSNSEQKNYRSNESSPSFYTGMALKRYNFSHSNNSRITGYPDKGSEIVCKNIPRCVKEDDVLGLMEKLGQVWELRIITHDPKANYNSLNGKRIKDKNNCYVTVYVTFMTKTDAEKALTELNGQYVQGNTIKASWPESDGPRRLQLFNFDHEKSKPKIYEQISSLTNGLVDVIYKPANDICLLEYETHSLAQIALERLLSTTVKKQNFYNCNDGKTHENGKGSMSSSSSLSTPEGDNEEEEDDEHSMFVVDWASGRNYLNNNSFNNNTIANYTNNSLSNSYINNFNSTLAYYESRPQEIKALHVRNLTEQVGEEELRKAFESFGKVERVKKVRSFAFVHFQDPLRALQAMRELNNTALVDARIQITVAKKPFNIVINSHTHHHALNSHSNPHTHNSIGSVSPNGHTYSPMGIGTASLINSTKIDYKENQYHRNYFSSPAAGVKAEGGGVASLTGYPSVDPTDNKAAYQHHLDFPYSSHEVAKNYLLMPSSGPTKSHQRNSHLPNSYLTQELSSSLPSTYQKYYANDLNCSDSPIANGNIYAPVPPPFHRDSQHSHSAVPSTKQGFVLGRNLISSTKSKVASLPPLISKLQPIIDNVKEPLIGLKYITEYHSYSNGILTTRYECSVCDITLNTNKIPQHKILDHIRSNDHIRAYIVKDHADIWNALVNLAASPEANASLNRVFSGSSPPLFLSPVGGSEGDNMSSQDSLAINHSVTPPVPSSSTMSSFFPLVVSMIEARYSRQKIHVKHDPKFQPRTYSAVVDATPSSGLPAYEVNKPVSPLSLPLAKRIESIAIDGVRIKSPGQHDRSIIQQLLARLNIDSKLVVALNRPIENLDVHTKFVHSKRANIIPDLGLMNSSIIGKGRHNSAAGIDDLTLQGSRSNHEASPNFLDFYAGVTETYLLKKMVSKYNSSPYEEDIDNDFHLDHSLAQHLVHKYPYGKSATDDYKTKSLNFDDGLVYEAAPVDNLSAMYPRGFNASTPLDDLSIEARRNVMGSPIAAALFFGNSGNGIIGKSFTSPPVHQVQHSNPFTLPTFDLKLMSSSSATVNLPLAPASANPHFRSWQGNSQVLQHPPQQPLHNYHHQLQQQQAVSNSSVIPYSDPAHQTSTYSSFFDHDESSSIDYLLLNRATAASNSRTPIHNNDPLADHLKSESIVDPALKYAHNSDYSNNLNRIFDYYNAYYNNYNTSNINQSYSHDEGLNVDNDHPTLVNNTHSNNVKIDANVDNSHNYL
ncbi:unnamed protein product [Gordionus sp. m RMFG-2023]|uniref:uncharacterized protein LOC135922922 n=1 Tax=Gordionus sp. m RMFG-2023 TaxID=3053472 RepID=UPI0030E3DBFA